LPAQLSQCSDFVAAKRVNARLAILDAPDVQGGGPAELHLGFIPDRRYPSAQAMTERNQDQRSIAVTITPIARRLDQLA
jgi:hypothetical protein